MTSQGRNPTFYVLTAHGGAGYHSPASDSSLKGSLRAAISSALTAFSSTTATSGTASSGVSSSEASVPSALDAATTIIAALEDAPDFNAGYGSNLTFDGHVECDASLMSINEGEDSSRGAANTAAATSAGATPDSNHPSSSSVASSAYSYPYSFGSVGAVRGVRNPVLVARRVLEGRRRTTENPTVGSGSGLGLGLVPPLMLVGEGAAQFAREQGLRVVDGRDQDRLEEEMVAPRARREWRLWRERWDRCCLNSDAEAGVPVAGLRDAAAAGSGLGSGSSQEGREEGEGALTPRAGSAGSCGGDGGDDGGNVGSLRARQDTVGAVVLVGGGGDVRQQMAAGVSSGGLLLKHSGRIGEAAMFGAGCWVERSAGGRKVACSVSGQGELIVQSSLAKTLAERAAADTADDTHEILRSVVVDDFYGKWHRQGEYQPAVGVLLLTQGVDGDERAARLWCAFTTQSMAVAYASSRHPKPKAIVLRNTAHDFSNDDGGRPPLFITAFPC